MIKKVTAKETPGLFPDFGIEEFSIDILENHRRGSNFFTQHIVEIKEEDKEYFPDVDNFEDYIGHWKTNTVVVDADWGKSDDYDELTRVEKVEKTVVTVEWEEV